MAKLIRHRERYSIGPHPTVSAKRAAKADRDFPVRFANSATVQP
jgi:hypothetical protein